MKDKVLVVDDNPEIVEMVTSRLEISGYEVISALDGETALLKAREDAPDVILLDIAMPGMDGITIGCKLKQDISTHNIPIIMVTARSEQSDVIAAITAAGAISYITKPFRPEALLDAIKVAIIKSRRRPAVDGDA